MSPQDKAIISPPSRYATPDDFTPEWIAQVRGAIAAGPKRDGSVPYEVRGGFPACIEVRVPSDKWHLLNLPTNGTEFASIGDRDAILAKLHG